MYCVVDNSASMYGPAIQVAADAHQRICVEIDQVLGANAIYSTLVYDSRVQVINHNTSFATTTYPLTLTAVRTSNLARAWQQLAIWIETDSFDRALALLFTDGSFTDDALAMASRLAHPRLKHYGIGCGYHADLKSLRNCLNGITSWQRFDHTQFYTHLQQYITHT